MNALKKWSPFGKRAEVEMWPRFGFSNRFHEMDDMMTNMERWFGQWPARNDKEAAASLWEPAVDISEDDKEYRLKAELPEVKKEDIKVRLDDGMLVIAGERKQEKEEKNQKFHRIERSFGSFERRFDMPDDADASKVSSEFKNGVLTVHLQKNPDKKSHGTNVEVN